MKRLAARARADGGAPPTVVYFGGDDVPYRLGVPDFLVAADAPRGRIAVSAFYLAEGPAFLRYHGETDAAAGLEKLFAEIAARGRPAGRVGYSIYLYDLPIVNNAR